jgi:hypothetical protein
MIDDEAIFTTCVTLALGFLLGLLVSLLIDRGRK